MQNPNNDKPLREEVSNAKVVLFNEPHNNYPPIVLPDSETEINDLGDLVLDRIEANCKLIFPEDDSKLPDKGEKKPLGEVWWDKNGIPTRIIIDEQVMIYFTESGTIIQQPIKIL